MADATGDERVESTEQDGTWTLRPADGAATTGIMFYPGARVQPAAYVANWTPIVAESGVAVVIPRMPLSLRPRSVPRRGRVPGRSRHRPVARRRPLAGWAHGHQLARRHGRRAVGGVVLWASFPTGGAGLEERPELAVLSVGGTRDGLSTPGDLRERRALLPPDAELVFVEGIYHAQFGRLRRPAWRSHADDR